MADGQVWLTVPEAARLWRVDRRTIIRWVHKGFIEGCRMGPRVTRILVASDVAEKVIDKGDTTAQPVEAR